MYNINNSVANDISLGMICLLRSEGQRRTHNCSRFPISISAYWSRESSVLYCCRLTEVSRFSFWFPIWVTRTLQGNMSAFTRRYSFFPEPYGFSCWLRFQINSLGLWGDKFCLLSCLTRGIREVKIMTEWWYQRVCMRGNESLTSFQT